MVSRSGDVDSSWAGSVLLRDIADVKRLREEDGPNLVTQGSTELVHALLANDLVDGMTTFTVPVVLGSGKKLFADGSAPQSLEADRIARLAKGPRDRATTNAAVRSGSATRPSMQPSKPEAARQERMKREG